MRQTKGVFLGFMPDRPGIFLTGGPDLLYQARGLGTVFESLGGSVFMPLLLRRRSRFLR